MRQAFVETLVGDTQANRGKTTMIQVFRRSDQVVAVTTTLLCCTGCVGFATTATNAVYLLGLLGFILVYLSGRMIQDEEKKTTGWVLRIIGLVLFLLA